MLVMQRLRLYHAALAVLVVLSYLTGEFGIVHAWLGYGVAAVIFIRLVWAMAGVPPLGLMRFYPHFEGLRFDNVLTHPAISRTLMLGIAATVMATVATGIAMDQGHSIGFAALDPIAAAHADGRERDGKREDDDDRHGIMGEVHEAVANLIIPMVGLHVAYLLVFKRPLARFMLFIDPAKPVKAAPPPPPA